MKATSTAILEAREEMIVAGALNASSKLRNLTDDHFVQVVSWLCLGVPPMIVAEKCRETDEAKGGLALPPNKAPSKSRLYEFWSVFGPFLLRVRRRHAAQAANAAGEDARKSPVDWQRANADRIQQMTFELLSDPAFEPETVKAFVQASIKLNSLEFEREKLRRSYQEKIDAGLEEIAKELPADLMARIREVMAAKVAEAGK